ncbi:MAG: ATP-dependent zinc metalloprotease FtsH [Calothrix sp. C42_A2020_038]|nr:ATP-dependent zinc metalloprotease FtsH [Calothrix sp. C42_A2020_038]
MPVETDGKTPIQSPEPKHIGGSLFLWFIMLIFINLLFWVESSDKRVPYSTFVSQVEAGKVIRASIGKESIKYELKQDTNIQQPKIKSKHVYITTPIPNDVELPKILRKHQVEYSAESNNIAWILVLLSWVIPPLIFFSLLGLIFNRSGMDNPGALTIGKSKARIYSEGSTGVKFDDVAGVDEAKAELQEIVDFLRNATKYTNLGAKIPKGVLLVGPPGTGKTLLAKAIAGEAGVPFFTISGSEFIELFVGIGAARVRDLFEQAKQKAPCIVFIDELDALGKSREGFGNMLGGNDEREQTLNQLLSEMDGFDTNTGVIILAATNRPDVLDPALSRPGRFDRQIVVDRPDKIGREAILKIHAQRVKLADDVNLPKLAARTPGFAGADLANLVNEAALLAARKNHNAVTMADFNEAVERVLTGLEKKSRILNEVEKKTVAYHEVGHALIAAIIPGAGHVEKISIVPRGIAALGYTLQLPEEDRFLMTEDEIRGRIVTLLGGRAAEELIFFKVSTGASDDIQKATDLAERFVTQYGMSIKLGPITFEKTQQQFLNNFTNSRRMISEKIAEQIDQEVKEIIDGAHQLAFIILRENEDLLKEIADILLEKEVLEGEELSAYLTHVKIPKNMNYWLGTGNTTEEKITKQQY